MPVVLQRQLQAGAKVLRGRPRQARAARNWLPGQHFLQSGHPGVFHILHVSGLRSDVCLCAAPGSAGPAMPVIGGFRKGCPATTRAEAHWPWPPTRVNWKRTALCTMPGRSPAPILPPDMKLSREALTCNALVHPTLLQRVVCGPDRQQLAQSCIRQQDVDHRQTAVSGHAAQPVGRPLCFR